MTEIRCTIAGCGKRDPETGERTPRLAQYGFTCESCFDRYVEMLPEVIDMYALLPDLLDPDTAERAATAEKIHSNAPIASPAGARLDVIAMLDYRTAENIATGGPLDVLGVLESWTRMIREERRMKPSTQASITTEVNFLSAHATWCAAQSWIGDMVDEVRQVWQQLRHATGRGPDPILGHCGKSYGDGECGGAIRQIPGELSMTCGKCGEVWETPVERARGTLMMRVS